MDLKEATEHILFSNQDFYLIKKGIEQLKTAFAKTTGVAIGNMEKPIMETEKGIVVSIEQAAHCLIDMARTTQFLRGIYQAIQDKLQTQSNVRILYAGCGPYATLISPLTTQFQNSELSITLVDINEESIDSVSQLIAAWSLEEQIENVISADLTDPYLKFDQPFDIIISETMQFALRNECQVPITRNLIRFLKPEGLFIPESITIDACLVDSASSEHSKSKPKLKLGRVYDLNSKKVPEENLSTILKVPETRYKLLQLFTEIRVYKDTVIEAYDSGLTMPYYIDHFTHSKPKQIRFQYIESTRPNWEVEYFYQQEKVVAV